MESARKQSMAPKRKAVHGQGVGYTPEDLAYMEAQDKTAPQTFHRERDKNR